MTGGPRRRVTLSEHAYAAALAVLALAGAVAPERPLPDVVPWSGPFPVHRLGEGAAVPVVRAHESLDLEVAVAAPRGDPYDAAAVATFEDGAGGVYRVEAFYAGGERGRALYRFRFTPPGPGEWRFATSSDVPGLDGLTGTVVAEPAVLAGPMRGSDGRFLLTRPDGSLAATTYVVYSRPDGALDELGELPRDEAQLAAALQGYVDEAARLGFGALHVAVNNEWFGLGTTRYDLLGSTRPDPRTFRVLETLVALAHRAGLYVHVWMWGDESRRHSPLGLPADPTVPGDTGGVTGAAFDRLQRYLAARLGPLPNWTASFGFDLHEWASEEDVRAWARRLDELLPLPHLLAAVEEGSGARAFDLGEEKLSLVSRDLDEARFGDDPYGTAVLELARAGGRPLLLESQLYATRGGGWDGDGLRRTLWRLAVAGGVGSVWRVDEGLVDAEQLRTFARFWEGGLPVGGASRRLPGGELALVAADGRGGVVYAEDAGAVSLAALPPGARAVAVDARAPYAEVEVASGGADWEAPRVSDWALRFTVP